MAAPPPFIFALPRDERGQVFSDVGGSSPLYSRLALFCRYVSSGEGEVFSPVVVSLIFSMRERPAMQILVLNDLKENLKDVRGAVHRMILERSAENISDPRAELKRLSASMDSRFDELLAPGSVVFVRLRPSVAEARDIWNAFRKTCEKEIIPAVVEGRFRDATAIDMGIQEERYREFISIVDLVESSQNLETRVEEKTREVHENFFAFIRLFADVMELFDPATGGHSKRVAALVQRLAEKLGLMGKDLDLVVAAAYLHTIGLIAVPRDVLDKEESVRTGVERKMHHGYPQLGQGLLSSMETLNQAGLVIRSHLERYDGKGYPDGLKGEEIHIGARILAVCRAYDLARNRKKAPASHREALEELKRLSGSVLDPMVVDEFIALDEKALSHDPGSHGSCLTVHVWELRPGMRLLDRLVTSRGRLLLTGGTLLTEEVLEMIRNYHRLDPIVTLARVSVDGPGNARHAV